MVGVLVFPSLPWDTYVETSLLVRTTNNEQRLHLLDVFFFQQSTTSITNYIVYCSQMPPPNMIIPPPTIIHTFSLTKAVVTTPHQGLIYFVFISAMKRQKLSSDV